MKFFKTIFIVVSLIIFTMCVSNLFAQDGYVNPMDGSDVPLVEESTNILPEDNVTNKDPRVIIDEYGSQSVNRALNLVSGSPTKRVHIPPHPDFDQVSDGSIEMWVYLAGGNPNNSNTLITKGNNYSTRSFYFGISSQTPVPFFQIGTTVFYPYNIQGIPLNTWTHVAVTWTGGPNYTVRYYINGSLEETVGPINATWPLNNDPVIIGGYNPYPSAFFEGYIDEVRFWAGQRTTAQIRDNRFVGLGDFGAANTGNALTSSTHYAGLISSWTFNYNSSIVYDDIGQHDGTYMGGCGVSTRLGGQPIPYNLALFTGSGSISNRVEVPHNIVFNSQTGNGSVEMWINPTDLGHHNVIISKGETTGTQTTFYVGLTSTSITVRIGDTYYSSGHSISTDKWTHLAVTWTGGPNFIVKKYINGVLVATDGPHFANMNTTNTQPLVIGGSVAYPSSFFEGYIDEVRFWSNCLTDEQVKNNMIISGRALLPNSQLIGCWNFDGNLGNWSAVSGIDGTFNVIGINNARLSGYTNENTPGAYGNAFNAHTTTINGTYVGQAYFRGKSGLPIPDMGNIQDTIKVTKWPSNVTTVHALISIQHEFCEDLNIRITAPNGQTRDISTDNGGTSNNGYLTIFYDGHSEPVTSSSFLSPWSNYVKPEVTMGNFGGSPINGNWILRVMDDSPLDVGTVMGWGLRFNNSTINVSPISSNVPGEYKLHQNYPNPFNPVTNINFDIPRNGLVSIKVYDITGREISTLANQYLKAGSYNVEFDASNLASGTYFYKIQAGDFTDVKKMMLVK